MSKKHMGSSLDDFLKEEGIFEEAQAQAVRGTEPLTKFKIQSHAALKKEMKAVARGEKPAPEDAATASFNSVLPPPD